MKKVGCVLLSVVIFIVTISTTILPCFASSSDSELNFDNVKPVDFSSWADVPDDYKALGEAYLDLFSDGTDSIFNNLEDIPISWLKIVNDINPVISPLDGLYYLLDKNEVKAVQVEPSGIPKGVDVWKNRHLPSRVFKERLETKNTEFSPKNATGKMTYWNDELYQTHYKAFPASYKTYNNANLYTQYKFVATNSNDIYILLYYKMDDVVYYSKFQYHLYFVNRQVSYTDSIYTLFADVWDNAEQTKEEAATYSVDVTQYPHATLAIHGAYDDFIRVFDTLANYKKNNGRALDCPEGMELKTLLTPDLTQSLLASNVNKHFGLSYEEHKANCTADCDYGYIASVSPIVMHYDIDTSKIPDDAVITVGGDNIYNYYITNPDTGESSTMNEYITNNYTYITNNNGGGEGSGSSGSVGGNVTVDGEIAVGGQVGVDITVSVPDININVNGNGAGGTEVTPNPDDFLGDSEVDLTSYYDKAVEDASGVRQFLGSFFDFLPAELLGLLCLLVAVAICCRIFGR